VFDVLIIPAIAVYNATLHRCITSIMDIDGKRIVKILCLLDATTGSYYRKKIRSMTPFIYYLFLVPNVKPILTIIDYLSNTDHTIVLYSAIRSCRGNKKVC